MPPRQHLPAADPARRLGWVGGLVFGCLVVGGCLWLCVHLLLHAADHVVSLTRPNPRQPASNRNPSSDHDHTSEPHSPYDGPSRTHTPRIGAVGQHAAAIAAAVAEVQAAHAAGHEASVRFQLPPRPPHHAGSSGSLGSANGNGHSQQDAQQDAQQAQDAQQGAAADDVAARLAVLRTR